MFALTTDGAPAVTVADENRVAGRGPTQKGVVGREKKTGWIPFSHPSRLRLPGTPICAGMTDCIRRNAGVGTGVPPVLDKRGRLSLHPE